MHGPLSAASPEIYSLSLIAPPRPLQDFLIFSDCTKLRVARGSLCPHSSDIGKVLHLLRILALSHTAFTPINVITDFLATALHLLRIWWAHSRLYLDPCYSLGYIHT